MQQIQDPETSRNEAHRASHRQGQRIPYSSGIYSHLSESQKDDYGIWSLIPGFPHILSGQQKTKGKILFTCFLGCLIGLFLILFPWLPNIAEALLHFFKRENTEQVVDLFRFPTTFKTVYSLLIVSLIGYLIIENKRDVRSKFRNLEKDRKPSIFAASLSGSYLANTCLFFVLIFYGLFFHFVPVQKERSIELEMPFVDNPEVKKEPKEPPKEAKRSAIQNAVNSGRHNPKEPLSPGVNQPKQMNTPKQPTPPSKPAPSSRPSPFNSQQTPSPQPSKPLPPSPFRIPTPQPKSSSSSQNRSLLPTFKPKASDDKPLLSSSDTGQSMPLPMQQPGSSNSGSRSGSSNNSYQPAYAGSPGRGPVLPSSPGGYSHGSGFANAGPNNNPNGPITVAARKDADYGPYMKELERRIQAAWKPTGSKDDKVQLSFHVRKDGTLVPGSLVTNKSSNPEAEAAARQAVLDASPSFRPLPPEATSEVTINFTFNRTGVSGQKRY